MTGDPFVAHRSLLFTVAYEMLGSAADAEDVLQETWENCAEGAEVTLLSLEGGGHTWPGAPLSVGLGSTSQHINATDVIWDFFVSHPMNSSR